MASKSKGSNKSSKAEQVVEQSPVAVVQEPELRTPASKRGNSSVKRPVAVTWAICINKTADARSNPEAPVPSRTSLVAAAIDAGVGYYTARTQVQAFLKSSQGGRVMPTQLPRDLALTAPAEQ